MFAEARRASTGWLSAALLAGCAVGDDTVFVDSNGSRYAAEVFCAEDFEGVRVSMVPGPGVDLSPLGLPDAARGCVRLRLAQTTQTRFDVSVNESFVLTGGELEPRLDCRIGGGRVGTATAALPLDDAVGAAQFEDGPEGTLTMNVDLAVGGASIPVRIDDVDVRRGGCDVAFF